MLSGQSPFVADNVLALMHEIAYEYPPALRDLTRAYPPRASEVLKKGLAKEPGQRYATCAEFIGDLSASLEEGKPTAPKAPSAQVSEQGSFALAGGRKVRAWRHRWAIALGLVALATAILFVV